MPSISSSSGPTPADRFVRAAALAVAIMLLATGCVDRRADGTRASDSLPPAPAGRVDTVVRVETLLVHDSLVAIGDTVAAASITPGGPHQAPAATPGAASVPAATLPPFTGGPNPPAATPALMSALAARHIIVPIAGIPAAKLPDTFNEMRGGTRRHEALDIMSPRNTPIHSVDDGSVIKLFTSKAGGLTIYTSDPTGHFIYYYAHLDHYAPELHEGQPLRRGDVIGYVGSTGDASADAPHLHFAIALSNNVKEWWKGTAVDPTPVLQGTVK